MFEAFRNRQPWAAGLLTLIFGPFIGMLYLKRGLLALAYLGAEFAVAAAILIAMPHGWGEGAPALAVLPLLLIRLAGTVHAVTIASNGVAETPKWYARWYVVAGFALAPLALALVLRTFFIQSFDIPSGSMSPSLDRGDYFFVKKGILNSAPPQRGDIVVFYARDLGANFVKRIVGLPGDQIQMRGGVLYINGKPAQLRRVEDYSMACGDLACPAPQYVETLPEGRSYKILDLVANAPADNTDVFHVPPGHYFVLGDNRDNSNDSRFIGYIAASDIVGKAWMKYLDRRHTGFIFQPIQ